MILHSYHPEYKWTADVQSGINEVFLKSKLPITTQIQYMDSKRYQEPGYFEQLYELYRYKYQENQFDLILTSDDNAFDFALKYRDSLFPNVPLIFCGVNDLQKADLEGLSNLSGVNEKPNLAGGMELALRIHPKTREMLIITDSTSTGRKIRKELEQVIETLPSEVSYRILEDVTIEELLSVSSTLPKNSVLYLTLFIKDSKGRFFQSHEVAKMLVQQTELPVYGTWDFNLGDGIVGGLLTSGLYQGRTAAEMAVSHFRGIPINEASLVLTSPNRYMFDYTQLKRHNIALDLLPDDSTLINKPVTFYQQYRVQAWFVGLCFLFVVLLLLLQRKHIVKHKENEMKLQHKRQRLSYLNKTLEKKVEERTQELTIAKEAAEQAKLNALKSQAEVTRYVDIVDRYVISSQTDLKGIITEASTAFCEISGYSKAELIGQTHNIVRHPDTPSEAYKEMWEMITKGKAWSGEIKNKAKDGSSYRVDAKIDLVRNETGDISGYLSIRHDITDKKRVEELSITDSLTGLSNRFRLDDILLTEFKRVKRYSLAFSIIICDIDFFKAVNDNYGHLAGDLGLVTVAQLLSESCREVDFVGRWGGEEFLIVCPETSAEQAALVAEKLRLKIAAHQFPEIGHMTSSFGVTLVTNNDSIEEALKRADNALYRAKENGRNRVELLLS